MLEGLRFSVTIPRRCAQSSAPAIWEAMSSASAIASGPSTSRSASVEPSTNSRIRPRMPSASSQAVNGADVRMIQRRQSRASRSNRAAHQGCGEGARQDLDGDITPEFRITRAVHLAHAAHANPLPQVVNCQAAAQ